MKVPSKLGEDVTKMKLILAVNLYERRKLSINEAADMAGSNSTNDFIGLMGDYNAGLIFA